MKARQRRIQHSINRKAGGRERRQLGGWKEQRKSGDKEGSQTRKAWKGPGAGNRTQALPRSHQQKLAESFLTVSQLGWGRGLASSRRSQALSCPVR